MDTTTAYDIVNSWLQDLSAAVGEELSLDDEGLCCFRIERETVITMEVSSDFPVLNIYSPILPLPDQNTEERVGLLTRILEVNAFQSLTQGGSLALVPGGNLVFYCFSLPIEETDAARFDQILGKFYSASLEIRDYFKKYEEKEDDLPEFRITA